MRINSAKDAAAGLTISERFTSQIRGLNQAVRNANDGMTAEGALKASGDILQRVRELAVQSANATNSAGNRQAQNAEVTHLVAEIDRIAQTTEFNSQRLLDGTFGTAQFQVGANANQTIGFAAANLRTQLYSSNRFTGEVTQTAQSPSFMPGSFQLNGFLGSATVDISSSGTAITAAQKVNSLIDQTGITATAKTFVRFDFGGTGSFSFSITSANGREAFINTTASNPDTAEGLAAAVDAINAQVASNKPQRLWLHRPTSCRRAFWLY